MTISNEERLLRFSIHCTVTAGVSNRCNCWNNSPILCANGVSVGYLLFICCKDPMHWNLPFTIMASRVQRASHSSMLKEKADYY